MVVKTETLLERREKINAELRGRSNLPVLTFMQVHDKSSCQVLEDSVKGVEAEGNHDDSKRPMRVFCLACGVWSKLEFVKK